MSRFQGLRTPCRGPCCFHLSSSLTLTFLPLRGLIGRKARGLKQQEEINCKWKTFFFPSSILN